MSDEQDRRVPVIKAAEINARHVKKEVNLSEQESEDSSLEDAEKAVGMVRPSGVSPTGRGPVKVESAPLSSGLTVGKVVRLKDMGISVAPMGIAGLDTAFVDELAKEKQYTAEELAELRDEKVAERGRYRGVGENSETQRGRRNFSEDDEDVLNEVLDEEQQEEPREPLFKPKRPVYQTDLAFAQGVALSEPKIVALSIKEWINPK